MPHLYIINSQFTEEKHVCWMTRNHSGFDIRDGIDLIEIVKRIYPHPDAPENVIVEQLEEKFIATFQRAEIDGATSILLEAAQNAVSRQVKK